MGKAEMKLHTTAQPSVGQRENGDPDYNIRHRVHAESRKRRTTSVARSDDFSANQTERESDSRTERGATFAVVSLMHGSHA